MDWKEPVDRILLTEEEISSRIKELGAEITRDYSGKKLLIVGILKGAIVFFTDLARAIDLPLTFDFISISSYGSGTTSSGEVRFLKDVDQPVEGYDVLFIEDIVDSGRTLSYLLANFAARKPNSIKICCLLDKKERRTTNVKTDYVGFDIENEFVIGYGLDYDGRYRNLPYIGILKRSEYGG